MVLSRDDRPTLMLLPGLLCDETVWEPQIEAFGTDWHIIVPDFRGRDSFDRMAELVLARAPARFSMAGHSMGGRVALEALRQAPERVERLALFSTGVQGVMPGEAEKRQIPVDLAWRDGMEALARSWIPPVLHPSRREDAVLVERLVAMWCRATPAIHEGQIRAALNRRDATPLLPSITCPTLVLGGADDPWSTAEQQRAIAAAIPGAQLVIIPECGHMVTVERPAEVNAALRAWLATAGAIT
jgi:pimeloyl-ACP methyl ester carboxylesterase